MNLSAPFILRPVMTTLLTIALLIAGIVSFLRLPISNLPNVNYPIITVTVPFPGASPVTMANTVAVPLEKQFMTIPGIKYVTSNNTLGSTTIILEFEINRNIDLAAVDVESAIVAAQPHLPPNLPQAPTFRKVNPSATPIMYIGATSPTMTEAELHEYGDDVIGQRISMIEGVAQVLIYGSPRAVRAQVDPGFLASLGLTLQDIGLSVANANQYEPLGQFDGYYTSQTIYDNGGLFDAQEYEPLIVAYRNGAPIRLENLGDIINSVQKNRSFRRYISQNIDQPNVTLAVQGAPGGNAVQIADAVHKLLSELKKELPGSLELITIFNRSISIRESIHDLELTLIIAFALVVLVIYLYLGKWRDTIIPAIAMPMSIIGTFLVMSALNYLLDILSLLALTLAIGFIIDDAIVVLENIVRHIEGGEKPFKAALEGSKQISFTIVSMTLGLVAVFIPFLFMAGFIGVLFEEFSVTLTAVTVLSGIISLTLTPMLCSRFLPPREKLHAGKGMAAFSVRFNAWMLERYKKGLSWALKHRLSMLLVGAISVVLTFVFFKILPIDFIPNEDIGFLIAYTEAEQGTSSDQMFRYQTEVADFLRKQPEIESMVSISGVPEFRQGLIFTRLIPLSQRQGIETLMQEWSKKLRTIPGVNVYMRNIPLIDLNIGAHIRGNYQYLLQSLHAEPLYEAAEKLLEKMRGSEGFQDVTSDLEVTSPQITLDIHRDQAYALGIDVLNFESALLLSYSGNRVTRIQTPVNQWDVILELKRQLQNNDSSLYSIYLRSNNGSLVPLSAVADWKEDIGPASVNHFAQFPAVTVTFNMAPGVPLSEGLRKLQEFAKQIFPENVTGSVTGAAQTFEEAIQSLAILLIVTVLTIYLILGILYESFIHPLTILSTLPPAIVGGLLTLYIFGLPLSLYSFLGLIMLIGIVKKNGIMMVDFALDNIRTKGESAEKSIYEASLVRFRPIMMTTVAAIMGALPIATGVGTGSEARRPLGYVIIGGLLVSQLITLFLTPVIYLYLERLREKFSK